MNIQSNYQNLQQSAQQPTAFEKKAREAANGFESFFVYQMIDTMSVDVNEEFGGGFAEEMFKGFQNEYMAENIVKSGSGIGLADQVYSEILKAQEVR